jgi:hypothetical protein
MTEKGGPANPDMNKGAGPVEDSQNIPANNENVKCLDIEALTERAAIMQYDGGLTRYEAERRAAELYGLTNEERKALFPLPRRAGFDAVLFMVERGFRFLPWDEKEDRPAFKWAGANQKNFTGDTEKLNEWSGAGFRRFMYLPGSAGYIGFDIDVGHADGRDGLAGFYNIMESLAGKKPERLPLFLRDLPRDFPCYVETPSGGLHLLFRYAGQCKRAEIVSGENKENKIEIKHLNSCLSLGEKKNGPYTLAGDPLDAPDLPLFLAELINPRPAPVTAMPAHRHWNGKPGLEQILQKLLPETAGHNDAQKRFAYRAAYFGYGFEETLSFVKSRADGFGDGGDTETVVRHAWGANTGRAAS